MNSKYSLLRNEPHTEESLPLPNSSQSFFARRGQRWRSAWNAKGATPLFLVAFILTIAFGATFAMLLWPRHEAKLELDLGLLRKVDLPIENITVAYTKVVGLVFFGRRSRVSILDCYLKRNLVENGGMLDEVRFVAHTEDQADLDWLDELVTTSGSYSRVDLANPGETTGWGKYGSIWDLAKKGEMYIKLDDDVVFIGDDTIPSLVASKVKHPEHLVVAANIVNNPALAWVHYHLGAMRPYLPELSETTRNETTTSWRASELPEWSGPKDYHLAKHPSPPSSRHRWLPLPSDYSLEGTPATLTSWTNAYESWSNWAVAAQEHYSFLDNLEHDRLDVYAFDLWNYYGERVSINMIAVLGDDVIAYQPFPDDDEHYLTEVLPERTGRHAVVDGKALAVHYAFFTQTTLDTTDLLDRYRAYADEMICTA